MQIELADNEATLIRNLLNTPVQIAPQDMAGYMGLVQGIANKLQPKQPPVPKNPPVSKGKK